MLLANKTTEPEQVTVGEPYEGHAKIPVSNPVGGERFQVDDVQRLMSRYRQGGLDYQEIRRRDNLQAIHQRWPLLAELDDTI